MAEIAFAKSVDPSGSFTEGISAYLVSFEELGEFGNLLLNGTLALLYTVAIYCLFNLWSKKVAKNKKIIWTIIILIPLFGVLIYGYSFSDRIAEQTN